MRKIFDPNPGLVLDEIAPLSKRARSLLARAHMVSGVQAQALLLHDTVMILEGLDYHYRHMAAYSDRNREGSGFPQTDYGHEVTAYLNRLGQLYYFLHRGLGRQCGIDVSWDAPSVKKFVVLRHKYAAHRSIDMRRGESDMLAEFHLIGMSGSLRQPRLDSRAAPLTKNSEYSAVEAVLRESLPVYQIQTVESGVDYVSFCPEIEHLDIMTDAYRAFAKIIATLKATAP